MDKSIKCPFCHSTRYIKGSFLCGLYNCKCLNCDKLFLVTVNDGKNIYMIEKRSKNE